LDRFPIAKKVHSVEPAALTQPLILPVGHDDQVDALGLIGRMLDEMVGGRGPAPVVEPDNRDDYRFYDRSEVDAENDWKTI
jgi:hypothetical protein